MALRLMEVTLPFHEKEEAENLMAEFQVTASWFHGLSAEEIVAKLVIPAEATENIMDALEKRLGASPSFKVILFPIEAVLPRIKVEVNVVVENQPAPVVNQERVSREELYHDIVDSSKLSRTYMILVVLSTLVAVFGILYENITAIIGAMVIAPLLGPNVALSLATTLGDFQLAKKAATVKFVGLFIALSLSIVLGYLLPIHADNTEILARTQQVRPGDLVLALASGCAGALAFTAGVSASLIGVMVAVALLPPLVTVGLMIGISNYSLAYGAALLFATNVICINLAGVLTFLMQGIRPMSWWEAGKARKATGLAMLIWLGSFLVLLGLIFLSKKA